MTPEAVFLDACGVRYDVCHGGVPAPKRSR